MIKICSGTFSQDRVLRDTVHDLAQSGLRSIDFDSGRSMQLDTAARVAIRTGCHQLAGKVSDKNIAQTGENLVYVSKHRGARNTGTGHANHEQWQGKVYYIKPGQDYWKEAERIGQDYITDLWYATGYSVDGAHENDPLGLDGYNCRHNRHPWFEGVSTFPANHSEPDPEPVTINGRTYDFYAVTQKMRAMERSVRALKREKEALETLGMDTTEIRARIKRKTAEYKEFCRACGVPEKSTRLRYECGTSDLKKTQAWKEYEKCSTTEEKVVADAAPYDTMETAAKEKTGVEVHTVGKINREIYKCITDDIVTDEVIITDNQIQHIKDRHPNDYERFSQYFGQIVAEPDYIIEANKPDTAVILKEIVDGDEKFQTVLRLCTSKEPEGYKNSIITFLKIDEKRWNRYLRTKEILYKKM